MPQYMTNSVVTIGKSSREIEAEVAAVISAKESQGQKFVRSDEGPDYRMLWFEFEIVAVAHPD